MLTCEYEGVGYEGKGSEVGGGPEVTNQGAWIVLSRYRVSDGDSRATLIHTYRR